MRKALYSFYLLVLFVLPCYAAVAHVQSASGFMSGGTANPNFTGACASGAVNCQFSLTPTNANVNEVQLFFIGCACVSTTNVITMPSPPAGWVITAFTCAQLNNPTNCTSGTFGTSGNRAAAFWAYIPSTTTATFTADWAVAAGGFANSAQDEFSGVDSVNAIDAVNAVAGSGSCSSSVTPTVANDGIWGACNDTITAIGAGFTKGADDTQGDWSEWKILSGGSGTPQTVNFTGSGTFQTISIALKPAGSTTSGGAFKSGKSFSGGRSISK